MPPVTGLVLNNLPAFQTIMQSENVSEAKRVLIETVTQMRARRWNLSFFPSACRTIKPEPESDLLAALNASGSMDEIKQALRNYKQQLNNIQHRLFLESNINAGMKGIEPLIVREPEACQQEPGQYSDKNSLLSGISAIPDVCADAPVIINIDIKATMKKMGYLPCERGMCYGIAWTALLACVRQGGQAYMERMQYLDQMDTHPLSSTDDTHQVYPFFDAVTLSMTSYTDMSGYGRGIGFPGRQEINFPGRIIGGYEPDYVVPVVKHVFIAECTHKTFIRFLRQTQENNNGIPFGVMIHYPDHTTSIGFDGNKWLAANHNNHYYTETTDQQLYTFLREQRNLYKHGKMITAMEVVTDNKHSLNINIDTLVVNAKKSDFVTLTLHLALKYNDVNGTADCITGIGQQEYPAEVLLELLICKNAEGTPGFYVALAKGHPDVITVFIQKSATVITALALPEERKAELLCELLTSKKTNGLPGFCGALLNNHNDTITAFIQTSTTVITALALPDERKAELLCELLACKMENGTPAFYMTLQKDHPDAIITFIQASAAAIASLSLSNTEKAKCLCELLASKRADGTPGFCMALLVGDSNIITAFIQESAAVIGTLPLPEEEQKARLLYELLASKAADGSPGFFLALHNDNPEAINAFIQASVTVIAALRLSETQKAEFLYKLLASKAANDIPGFFVALQYGHTKAVTAFIQASAAAIASLSLSKAEKAKWLYELLASKRRDGISGFYMTLQNGYPDAITAFIQASAAAVTTLSGSEKERAQLLYGLFHSIESNNTSNFFAAINESGPAVHKAFTEGIDQLPLSPAQKETLKYPTHRFACRII